MRIELHIGLEHVGADRLQDVLAAKRDQMISKGVLYARSPGNKNHTRLFMAATDPDHIDPLRHNRGFATPDRQAVLRDALVADLVKEVGQHAPQVLILSCCQLGTSLARKSELERLRAMLLPLSDDIRITAHIDEQSRLLARHYAGQIMEGRAGSLELEQKIAGTEDWWEACLRDAPAIDPQTGQFQESQVPPFFLDYPRLTRFWEEVFGDGTVHLRPYDEALFYSDAATAEIRAAFGIEDTIGKAEPAGPPRQPAAAWLARGRQMNALLLHLLAKRDRVVPRPTHKKILNDIKVEGDGIDPSSLSAIAKTFTAANKALLKSHPALDAAHLAPPKPGKSWSEADPTMGYRASQYLLAYMWRIDQATAEDARSRAAALPQGGSDPAGGTLGLSPSAQKIMPPLARQNYEKLLTSSFKPHNAIGRVNEEELAAAYSEVAMRDLPAGNTGNVIVGCMKNEAPYIVEWVAYHRAMGVDNFLIYTNDCSDGTSELLDHLQDMGVLQHRNNDAWKGNSPQQYALNQSLKEPLIKNAEWIIHIDVDEFINVRCGNGTLADFLQRVPDATNVAMTWRLFGHNGVTKLSNEFVIDQFDTCAPKFCPKPHTVWGFKTMFKNIGAYEKISCHRPNKLEEGFQNKVNWVNGSGAPMGEDVKTKGWRNSTKSIGYDLLQLNHYALRSAESFLIKRQRGRALHVDRSIGINYWIRMDWSDFKDNTIKRNIPRLRAEYDRLMADDTLRKWHDKGLEWHRAKAEELHDMEEFRELYEQALTLKLTETERVAYALALDMES